MTLKILLLYPDAIKLSVPPGSRASDLVYTRGSRLGYRKKSVEGLKIQTRLDTHVLLSLCLSKEERKRSMFSIKVKDLSFFLAFTGTKYCAQSIYQPQFRQVLLGEYL